MSNIVITGASRGIGMAAALVLAGSGHSVIATLRDPARSPHAKRIAAMFGASLAAGAASPEMVGQKIREIIESRTWQLPRCQPRCCSVPGVAWLYER